MQHGGLVKTNYFLHRFSILALLPLAVLPVLSLYALQAGGAASVISVDTRQHIQSKAPLIHM